MEFAKYVDNHFFPTGKCDGRAVTAVALSHDNMNCMTYQSKHLVDSAKKVALFPQVKWSFSRVMIQHSSLATSVLKPKSCVLCEKKWAQEKNMIYEREIVQRGMVDPLEGRTSLWKKSTDFTINYNTIFLISNFSFKWILISMHNQNLKIWPSYYFWISLLQTRSVKVFSGL